MEKFVGPTIVLLLVALAGWFAWRQWQLARWLRAQPSLPVEERAHYRGRIFRRSVGVVLMMVLAVQMGGLFGMDVLARLDGLVERGPAAKEIGQKLTPEEERFVRSAFAYVGGIALVLFALPAVAFWETMAIRRWGLERMRRLRGDRQAMMERQFPNLYQDLSRRIEPKADPAEEEESDSEASER